MPLYALNMFNSFPDLCQIRNVKFAILEILPACLWMFIFFKQAIMATGNFLLWFVAVFPRSWLEMERQSSSL